MIKLQIQTHSSCFTCTHELQIQTHSLCFTCTHELQNRKKESLSLQLSSHEPCNDKQQNDQKLSAIQPQQTLRAVFLFIVQILLTTESNHIDISHMSTHPQEPIILRVAIQRREIIGSSAYSLVSSPSTSPL